MNEFTTIRIKKNTKTCLNSFKKTIKKEYKFLTKISYDTILNYLMKEVDK